MVLSRMKKNALAVCFPRGVQRSRSASDALDGTTRVSSFGVSALHDVMCMVAASLGIVGRATFRRLSDTIRHGDIVGTKRGQMLVWMLWSFDRI